MKRLCLLPLLGLIACGEPSLDLEFEIPAAYRDSVVEVVLRLHEPPVAEPFNCDDLALNRVDPQVLRASVVGEVVVRESASTPLPEVQREGSKLFLVEARDDAGVRLLAGCQVLGTLEGEQKVVIQTEPTTRVTVLRAPSLGVVLGDPVPRVRLLVTDLLDSAQPQVGLRVLWRLNGAGGTELEGSITTNSLGEAGFSATAPDRTGPFALSIEVPWAEEVPQLPRGFVYPEPEEVMVPGQLIDWKPGRVGPLGEPGLAGLIDEGANHRAVVLWRDANLEEVQNRRSNPIPTDAPAMGVLKSLDNSARDRVVVVTRAAWTEINPDGALVGRPAYQPPIAALGSPPGRMLSVGPCLDPNESQARLLVTYQGAPAVGFFGADGVAVGGFSEALDIVSSGCVAADDDTVIRTLVIDGGGAVGLLLAAEVEPNMYTVDPWIAVPSGTDFSPRIGTTPPLLLGTQVSINDFVISRASWSRQGERVALVQAGVDSPNDLPIDNAGGDIDGDGNLDVVALLQVPTDDQTEQYSLYVSLGQASGAAAIDAVLELPLLRQPTLHVLDFDGDGFDDILLAERVTGVGDARVFAYYMGRTSNDF